MKKIKLFGTVAVAVGVLLFGAFFAINSSKNSSSEDAQKQVLGTEAFRELLHKGNEDDAFNGIKIEEFENFYRDWHLVTARFRTDRNQQRVTFANDLAWKTLSEGGNSFPEGSIFAKAGFEVGEDPLFPSSKVPGAQLRLMLMKKDSIRYASTDGWGYALLNRFGTRLATGEIEYHITKYKSVTEFEVSCHACHKLARERDFVFSRPMFEGALSYKGFNHREPELRKQFHITASEAEINKVNLVLKTVNFSDLDPKQVQIYEMPLFEGSLPELRAPLTNLSASESISFLIFDEKTGFFALSRPQPKNDQCDKPILYTTGTVYKEKTPERNYQEITKTVLICNGLQI